MQIIHWPDGAAEWLGVSATTLQAMRKEGDCPTLYAPTPRTLVTTETALIEWLETKEVPAHYKCRQPVTRRAA